MASRLFFVGYMIFPLKSYESFGDEVFSSEEDALDYLLNVQYDLSVDPDSEDFWENHFSIDRIYERDDESDVWEFDD